MAIVYNKAQQKNHLIDAIENENGSLNIANIPGDELSTLNVIEQEYKSLRQQLKAIVNHIRQAPDIDTLLKVSVTQVREKIASDRALIYQLKTADSGTVIAESITIGWTPTLQENLPIIIFGSSTNQDYFEPVVIDDITQIKVTPYQQQLLDKFQIKGSLSLPILVNEQVWGLLVVNNCSSPRQWQELEITLLSQITTEIAYRIESYTSAVQNQQELLAQKSITKVIDRILHLSSIDKVFQITTQEIRQFLRCDRVAVYRFNPDWSGEFVAESVGNTWVKLVGPGIKTVWEDTHLQETQGGRYAHNESLTVNDIYQAGHSPCHVEILEQFEIKAYIIVPVLSGKKLWGLLAAYQNSGTRNWQSWEENFLKEIGGQFGVAISQSESLAQVQAKNEQLTQILEQEKTLTKIANRIRQSFDTESIFRITTQEVRQSLRCDRIGVYQFNPEWGGEFIAESVGHGWGKFVTPEMKTAWHDTYLQETHGGRYAKGENLVIDDIYQAGFTSCHQDMYEQLEIKALIIVPIFFGEKLWGLLAAFQHTETRNWQDWEVNFLAQIGWQFSIAKSQVEYFDQVRVKSEKLAQIAEQEKALTKLADRIRQSLDVEEIFKTVTQDLRQLLKCDRAVIYRFNPDWSGEFVAESVGFGWVKLVGPDKKTIWKDTQVQECAQIGKYQRGNSFFTNDIYNAGHSICHIETLEKYDVRAYVTVPIFFGDKLWGLLATYQNSGTRDWEESEINLIGRIADQLGIALQQTEYLQQVQAKSAQLAEAATREKAAKELLQQRSIQLLTAVRPALNGNLTVRAPITEDELGTIADAYNNTLQALRQIVIQVQTAAQQVVQTSGTSEVSLAELTNLAKQQSQEMITALNEIQHMVDSTQAVVVNAELVQVAVKQTNQTVESGDTAMNLTVQAIQGIRETVAQTSKKIKRLSESSQKISKVVNLISNFATQTNVLALNAAIEATRAGEYGKGFAVVADEVRSLSRQSAAATIEIEKLVQEIQLDTGEVAVAMETGIQQVVEGTNLVNDARHNLNAIVSATAEISQLIQQITETTQNQMDQSVKVTASMKDVAEISHKTVDQSHEIAVVFQELSGMAKELLATVDKFKVN
ncbi:methyl-accepting chemotaxis sensory transducer with phytochrome sensor [Calothrix sp. NIES-2100]|uniref:GAF domain-containing protein n=1 Tax=Calothrix sp. NIES-2100 TaxID=1954172 RepID=UPI000B5F15AB|nr:methyl-accepting chemotaxis sensory transducer with phytochrome sensor [Calothrix sp. NIES-2100]